MTLAGSSLKAHAKSRLSTHTMNLARLLRVRSFLCWTSLRVHIASTWKSKVRKQTNSAAIGSRWNRFQNTTHMTNTRPKGMKQLTTWRNWSRLMTFWRSRKISSSFQEGVLLQAAMPSRSNLTYLPAFHPLSSSRTITLTRSLEPRSSTMYRLNLKAAKPDRSKFWLSVRNP